MEATAPSWAPDHIAEKLADLINATRVRFSVGDPRNTHEEEGNTERWVHWWLRDTNLFAWLAVAVGGCPVIGPAWVPVTKREL